MKILVLCNDRMALPALSRLLQSGKIAGVGMPDRVNETQPVVKMLCSRAGVPFRQLSKGSLAADMRRWIDELNADVVLVKTFPWKIPAEVLDTPRFGFINFHYAPLPHFRGSNPLFWMIRNGVKEAGVTVHKMTEQFDEGPILLRSNIAVHPASTLGMLCTQLAYDGVTLTNKLLELMDEGNLPAIEQNDTHAVWYSHPKPENLWIKWATMNAEEVKRLVCACNPWNKGAATILNGWTIGLTYVTPLPYNGQHVIPGTILTIDETNGLRIACADNTILRADVVYIEEGFMPGFSMANFTIKAGMLLG